MFQGPTGYIAQICEVHLQYGNSTTKWPFTLFSSEFLSNIYSILFDSNTQLDQGPKLSSRNLSKIEYTYM